MRLSRIACRRLADTEKSNYALMAWAQQARILARDIKSIINRFKNTRAQII